MMIGPGRVCFVRWSRLSQGFAGYFFEGDEGNELVVLATTGAVGSTGVGGGGGGPGDLVPDLLSGTLPFDVSSVSVRTAEYSFLQLSEWRELIEPTIWASDDITGLDLDEQTNQLIVLLDTGRGEEEIRAAARLLGVPDAALGFEVSAEPVATDLTLRNAVRPARGGTQIQYLKSNGEILNCTYGFNAVMGSDTVMVTNSRCTPTTFGAPLNGRVWQADYDVDTPPIGTEFIDPPGLRLRLCVLGMQEK